MFGSFIALFGVSFFVVRVRKRIKRQLRMKMEQFSEMAMYALGHVTSQGNLKIFFVSYILHEN